MKSTSTETAESVASPTSIAPASQALGQGAESRWPTLDDEQLAHKVAEIVRFKTAGAIRDLAVEVRGADVRVVGRCRSFYHKQLAQHAAMAAAPGHTIVCAIDVD